MTNKIRYIMEGFDPKLPPDEYPATVTVTVLLDGTIALTIRPLTDPPIPTRRVNTPPLRRLRRHVTTGVRPAAGPNPYEHIQ